MEEIRKLLEAPDDTKDEFWDSGELIWIDWRDFDDSIINYFNKKLPDEDKIQFECVESEKERGIDIFLKKDGVSRSVPYGDDCTDRDTTLKSIQEYVSPKYQIRWYMESLGSDTLAFYWADFPVGAAGTGIRGRKRRLLFFPSPGRQRHV